MVITILPKENVTTKLTKINLHSTGPVSVISLSNSINPLESLFLFYILSSSSQFNQTTPCNQFRTSDNCIIQDPQTMLHVPPNYVDIKYIKMMFSSWHDSDQINQNTPDNSTASFKFSFQQSNRRRNMETNTHTYISEKRVQ